MNIILEKSKIILKFELNNKFAFPFKINYIW